MDPESDCIQTINSDTAKKNKQVDSLRRAPSFASALFRAYENQMIFISTK